MIRVSDRGSALAQQRHLGASAVELRRRQEEALSGKRVSRSSDDPVAAARLVGLSREESATAAYRENATQALGELQYADSALAASVDLLLSAKEIAQSLSNGSATADDRKNAAEEVAHYRDSIISLANTHHGGRYLFAGYRSGQPAFDISGNYNGDNARRRIVADKHLELEVGVNGAEVFAAASQGGRDVIADLETLRSALLANDRDAIAGAQSTLEAAREQVSVKRSTVGRQAATLMSHQESLEGRAVDIETRRSQDADVDAVEALSQLTQAQQALNSVIQISARLLSTLSLVDRL